jgi:hypothetical protein
MDLEQATMKKPTDHTSEDCNRKLDQLEPNIASRTILYHPGVSDSFDGWAKACGIRPDTLRRRTEFGIRNRHHQAVPEDPRYRYRPASCDVFRLGLGKIEVYYSIEQYGVLVRGYGWDITHEPLDERDGGGYFVN